MSIARKPVHLRRITCEGYARDDGLFDIEGTLVDTKPEPHDLPERHVAANEPVHRMVVVLTIDKQRLIVAAEARTLDSPYAVCGEIGASYARLVGLRIEPGFTQAVKRMFRNERGCSHMTELLPPMATTAYQILWGEGGFDGPATGAADAGRGGSPLGGCHALRLDGPVVRKHFRHLLPDEGAA